MTTSNACYSVTSMLAAIPSFARIMALYNDPRRKYHGPGHVYSLARAADKLALRDAQASFMAHAILYHDAYYSGVPDGSAENASAVLLGTAAKLGRDAQQSLMAVIRATEHYTSKEMQHSMVKSMVNPEYQTTALQFLDLDLATLQLPPTSWEAQFIERSIYEEALAFGCNPATYALKRALFLASMYVRAKHSSGFFHFDTPLTDSSKVLAALRPNSITLGDEESLYDYRIGTQDVRVRVSNDLVHIGASLISPTTSH